MNHLLNSFGISNYIRQMMCGIIYFIPFFLFAPSSTECFLKNAQGDWSSTKLLVVAVVAACIGTLIYHVEKIYWDTPIRYSGRGVKINTPISP